MDIEELNTMSSLHTPYFCKMKPFNMIAVKYMYMNTLRWKQNLSMSQLFRRASGSENRHEADWLGIRNIG